MKVLQINSVCGYGSTGRIVIDLYDTLIKQGHECKILYGRKTAPKNGDFIKIGNKIDVYFHLLISRLFDKTGCGSIIVTKKIIKQIESFNPDVIHLHNLHGYYINIKLLFNYLAKTDKKIVWTLHDCWAITGHCSYFDFVKCNKWKDKCYSCVQKKQYPKSIFIDNSKKNYELKKKLFTSVKNMTIVTPSNWLASIVKESYLNKYEIRTINNGIDLNLFKPTQSDLRSKHNLEDKIIILGVASNWDKRKGLDTFIDLAKQLDEKYKIVLVGLNKKQIKKLPSNILGIERTNNIEELVQIYSMADIFVNPTLEDTFPTTNLEAIACNTPVITFNTGRKC